MEIKVIAKSIYGETKYYPANERAEMLADIAGTKTLTLRTLRLAHMMGAVILVDGDRTLKDLLAA